MNDKAQNVLQTQLKRTLPTVYNESSKKQCPYTQAVHAGASATAVQTETHPPSASDDHVALSAKTEKRTVSPEDSDNAKTNSRETTLSRSVPSASAMRVVLDPRVLEHVPMLRCTSCDKPGHANNEDRQCEFYGRARGQIEWALNHPDSGLGNTVPHISETQIRVSSNGVEQTEAHREPFWYENQVLEIEVAGHAYRLGSASGDGCNCLIDTLRQKLPGIICNVSQVRQELENRHRGKATQISPGAYLSLDFWEDIVDLLKYNNAVTQAVRESWAHRFRVVCVDLAWIGHGEVFPHGARSSDRTSLVIARVNQNHFVPLVRLHDRPSTRRRPEL